MTKIKILKILSTISIYLATILFLMGIDIALYFVWQGKSIPFVFFVFIGHAVGALHFLILKGTLDKMIDKMRW